jgi:hypothetical protein
MKDEEPDAFADNGAIARAIPLGKACICILWWHLYIYLIPVMEHLVYCDTGVIFVYMVNSLFSYLFIKNSPGYYFPINRQGKWHFRI